MRAIHVTSQYPPLSRGGLATHVRAVCAALAPRVPTALFLPAETAAAGAPPPAGCVFHPMPGNPLEPDAAAAWGAAIAARAAAGGSAVIHVHNYESALPALAARALTGAPLVVTLHLPAPAPLAPLERRLLAAAGAVVAVSADLAAAYAARGWGMPAPVVVLNGVDADFFSPASSPRPASPGPLCFAGRLVPEKGLDVAIRALRLLLPGRPGLSLVVAGAGPWERAFRNRARLLGCADRVCWDGWLAPAPLRDRMRACGVFLMPGRSEPFGLSALEAMACGAPVVASRVGGLPEFIRDGVSGLLVPPGEPAALAAAVERLLDDPALAARLGGAAAEAARRLTWDAHARRLERIYRAVARAVPPPPPPEAALEAAGRAVAAALAPDGPGDAHAG